MALPLLILSFVGKELFLGEIRRQQLVFGGVVRSQPLKGVWKVAILEEGNQISDGKSKDDRDFFPCSIHCLNSLIYIRM